MWLFDVFARLYNLNPFTFAFIMWFVVLVITASVTMKYPTRRGKLVGFGITSVGAMLILGFLQLLTLSDIGKEIKGIVTNFVVMTLGGLGSGLLAVAISEGPTKDESEQARSFVRGLGLTIFEYVFVFILVCALSLSVVCLPLWSLGWPVMTGHAVTSLLVVFLAAALGCVIVAYLRRLKKWEQLGACLLFGWMLLLVPIYVQAIAGLVSWSLAAVLGFHTVAGIAMGWTVWRQRMEWL